jgi:iron complex outermembrane receptor protein
MLRRRTCTLLVAFLLPSLAGAQDANPTESESRKVETVLVQAPRPVTTAGGASAVEAVVDSMPVPAAATVEEVLRDLPLLHVRTNSRGEAEISARGSESRQVAVLVDGVPITLAWDARADISVIPATAVESVTFTRGLSSMLYGPNVLGGVVEARVGRHNSQPAGRTMQLTVGADDVGAFGTTVSTSLPFETESGRWLARAGLGFRDSPGDPLADGIREPIPTGDDLRLNTDSRVFDGFLAARYRANGGAWFAFSGSSFRRERGIAAELGVPDEDARLWRYPHVSRTVAVVSAGTGFRSSPFGGEGDVEASVGLDRGRTDIDAYASRAYDEVVDFEDGRDRTVTLRLLADQTLGARGDLRGAFTWSNIRHDELIPDGEFEYEQDLMSVGLENDWRLVQGGDALESLTLSAGGAYDRGETPRTGGRERQPPLSELGGRVGLSAAIGGGRTVLHAGVSRRGRFPALRELYSGALNRFVPNPDLKPEKLLTTEAGATLHAGSGLLQAVVFHNVLEDAVVRITLDDGTNRFLRVNRDELRTTGLELVGSFGLGPADVSASATLQSAELKDPQANDARRPENLPDVFGDVSVTLPIVRGLVGTARVSYTGDQFVIDGITGADTELPARAVVDASVSRTWKAWMPWGAGAFTSVEARLGVDNAGDVALYDAWGLPEPGRRIRLELRLR